MGKDSDYDLWSCITAVCRGRTSNAKLQHPFQPISLRSEYHLLILQFRQYPGTERHRVSALTFYCMLVLNIGNSQHYQKIVWIEQEIG